MHPISEKEFWDVVDKYPYYRARWEYFEVAIDYVQQSGFQYCLEIGAHRLPLFHNSDLLDVKQVRYTRPLDFVWNCDKFPWPVEDQSYDVVVALQVWEHLKYPRKSFLEVERIAKNAILSLPYKWGRKSCSSKNHQNITTKVIKKWTEMQPLYSKVVISGCHVRRRYRKRIVCCYGF